ncbi:MAG: hypothetical protein IVW55_08870 [Chloroflexi bacterium]|nr:hypothetical protein [Chloroflexota bacterium]
MAKKTKTSQQRIKEEQWRKRMSTQAGRTPGSAVMDVEDAEAGVQPDLPMGQTTYTTTAAPAPVAPALMPRSTTTPSLSAAQRTQSAAAAAAAQRRAQSTAARTARTRLTTSAMSIDEEMHYVRSDIRMLIVLTIVCVAIIVALSFVIK